MKNSFKALIVTTFLFIAFANVGSAQLPVIKSVAYYETTTLPKVKEIDAASNLDEVLVDVIFVQLSVIDYKEENDKYVLLITSEDDDYTFSFSVSALIKEEETGTNKIAYYQAWSLPGLSFPDENNGALMMLTIETNNYDKITEFEFYSDETTYRLIIRDLKLVDFDVF
jgi:hypothetical protein